MSALDEIKRKVPEFYYSEIFGNTFQGEGQYTGVSTIWLRTWGCNFECKMFGNDVDRPDTWEFPYENIDVTQYKSMEDLPVFHTGCDSSYSWAKKFQHLAHKDTAEGIGQKLLALLPYGQWYHPKTGQPVHLAITGGEPLMSQTCIVKLLEYFESIDMVPPYITFETNGTQSLRKPLTDILNTLIKEGDIKEIFWSVSPKLYISGESWDQAILPDVLAEYKEISNAGQLKYVCNGADRCWDEVAEATTLYKEAGINWPVWIMPVGADQEMQNDYQAKVSDGAIQRGYYVAPRVHVHVYGNVIGK